MLMTIRKVMKLIRNAWRDFASKDCFQLLDILWILGGGSLNLPSQGWKRGVFFLWHGLTAFHFGISLFNVVGKVTTGDSFSMTMWYLSFTAATSVCLIKMLFMWHHDQAIQQVIAYLDSKCNLSGDVQHDRSVREKYFTRARITIRIIFGLMAVYQVLFSIPHPQQDKLYHFPLLAYIGTPWLRQLVQFLYISTIPVIWFSKYFWCTGMIVVILMNFQAELKILIHKFRAVLERMESSMSTEPFEPENDPDRIQAETVLWNQLSADVGLAIEQHVEFIGFFQSVQPILGVSFLLYYYFALATYASVLFLILNEPISFVTIFQATSVLGSVLECYLICLLVDNFQEMNEEIQTIARDICIGMPHSDEHHSSYDGMRATMMIIILSNDSLISCAGVFDISVETFAGLIDTSYSYLTFLLSFR
uniref:Odorant receptor n=1 Tax=Culex quinquefasciatus TaxID=7176 RepID=A0A1S4JP43_CULQU